MTLKITPLKMTPPRLELLQAVADGAVGQYPVGGTLRRAAWVDKRDHGPGWRTSDGVKKRYQTVTARVDEMWRADLVVLGGEQHPEWEGRLWILTPTGRALLVEWGGKP